jgi:2-polyprenyl-3-methyl-5-hydroxy-6-metoxy-1,4-benzoquinol methylase
MRNSTPASHFERLYAERADPWNLSNSDYETQKYAATLEALPAARFQNAVEVGCSIGTLTEKLAGRCDKILGLDFVETPLASARIRCAGMAGVEFRRMTVPGEWPAGLFDLIILSEVLYFMSIEDLNRLAQRCEASLMQAGVVMLVNWRGANDGSLPGDVAAMTLLQALPERWRCDNVALNPQYRIDLARRR